EGDVPQPLAADLRLDDLDAALLADHPAVLHALVLAAVALVVLHRAEDAGAEQAVPLRLEGAVVDGLRLLHLTMGPLPDLVRARQRDADRLERQRVLRLLEEVEDVLHVASENLSRSLPDRSRALRGHPVSSKFRRRPPCCEAPATAQASVPVLRGSPSNPSPR